MKIGDIKLKHGLILAPMAGATDRIFREICKRHGAEFTISEMISAKAVCYESKRKKNPEGSPTARLALIEPAETPAAIQLFGCEPDFMAEAAAMLADGNFPGLVCEKPAIIDINMGCPVRKITSNKEGSALMREPETAAAVVRAVKSAVNIPVTVKIRAGWDEASVNASEFAKILEDAGADAITLHGRTKSQMYSGSADLEIIKRTKASVGIPLIGNGDVSCAADAIRMLEVTGCDGIMIGRGALGNPWIFAEITAALEERRYIPPTEFERVFTARSHLEMMRSAYGDRAAAADGKKQVAWYIKGIKNSAATRNAIMNSHTCEEILTCLSELEMNI